MFTTPAVHRRNEALNLWLMQLGDLGELWKIQTMCVRHSCQWECGFLGLLILAMQSEEYTVWALSRGSLWSANETNRESARILKLCSGPWLTWAFSWAIIWATTGWDLAGLITNVAGDRWMNALWNFTLLIGWAMHAMHRLPQKKFIPVWENNWWVFIYLQYLSRKKWWSFASSLLTKRRISIFFCLYIKKVEH